jgi:hypothetical protein
MKTHDPVNHPSHYTSSPAKCECGRQIECIQVTEHMNFSTGNAVKYLWRADLKADPIQDMEKAIWYIQREIDRRKRKHNQMSGLLRPYREADGLDDGLA